MDCLFCNACIYYMWNSCDIVYQYVNNDYININ